MLSSLSTFKNYCKVILNVKYYSFGDNKKSSSIQQIFCVKPKLYFLTRKNCLKLRVLSFFGGFSQKFSNSRFSGFQVFFFHRVS